MEWIGWLIARTAVEPQVQVNSKDSVRSTVGRSPEKVNGLSQVMQVKLIMGLARWLVVNWWFCSVSALDPLINDFHVRKARYIVDRVKV